MYVYIQNSYTSSVEHTFKDGSKTSEQSKGNDDDIRKDGVNINPARTTKVSTSTTDPSGNKTTKVYDNNGSKVVQTSQFDPRFNQTITTNFSTTKDLPGSSIQVTTTETKTISTPNSTTTIGPNGKTLSQVTTANDGTTTTWSFDANGNANGRTIKKPDGTTITATQSVPGGSFTSVTTDPKGTVISQNSCDKIANCLNPTINQNQQNLTAAKQQNLVGKNNPQVNKKLRGNSASAKKLQGQQQNPAGNKQQGLASKRQQIRAHVLNQIQNKTGSKGVKEGVKADVAKQIGINPGGGVQANQKETYPGKSTTLMPTQNTAVAGKDKNKEGLYKGEITPRSRFKAIPHSQSPSQFSQGNMHQPQNKLTKNYNAKSKSLNWNSSAGSRGTVKQQHYEKLKLH